jgi:hypothetical protein
MTDLRHKAQPWWAASRTLGLTLWDDTTGNEPASHFDTMVSSLRPHTTLTEHNWMAGTFEGHDVLVTYLFRDGGSSSDTLKTFVMVRIDPPLFLGLEVDERSFLSGIPKIGIPAFDGPFTVRAFDRERGAMMVWPGRAPELTTLLVEAKAADAHPRIVDSYVQLMVYRFEWRPDVLASMLRVASKIADVCADRRARIGETREEAALRASWARFADGERLQHDPAHRALSGSYRGLDAVVVTRTAPLQAWLGARMAFPIAPGINVTLTHETGLTRFGNMIGFSDITVGDAAFDHQFRVKGGPVQLVRHFFGRDATRAAAARLVQRFGTLRVAGATTAVMTPPADTPEELTSILDDLSTFVRAHAGGGAPAAGPYRG